MKTVIALLIVLLLLIGCGSEPTPIDKAQARAVEIGEQFLDYEITGTEARELLQAIKVPETETGVGQTYLQADINYLAFIIAKKDSTYTEIQERIDQLSSNDYNR